MKSHNITSRQTFVVAVAVMLGVGTLALRGLAQSSLIVYTADGHMAAQVYDTRRPRLGVPRVSGGAEAARTAFIGLSTYPGAYAIARLYSGAKLGRPPGPARPARG